MIRRFEEVSNNAWPALHTMQFDGWILRFANGVTKRSNSVSLLYPSTLDPNRKIDFCEHLYESQQLPPCFKITPVAQPAGIDQLLADRGYAIHSYISFQTMDIRETPALSGGNVKIEVELTPGWMDDFIRMNGFDPSRKNTYLGIMHQLNLPKCLISIRQENQTIGVGLGVVEDRYLGLFDIVVDETCRNRGLGQLIVGNILHWGRKQGADLAYLQVLTDNSPALSLYKKTGFHESYRYWYRMKK
jgi:ribosomal protein S18 acetylase RimI-like enzyme